MELVVNATPRSLYPPGNCPGSHCIGGCVGPRAGLDGCGKSLPTPGFNVRTVQPVASRLTYWAILAHYVIIVLVFGYSIIVPSSSLELWPAWLTAVPLTDMSTSYSTLWTGQSGGTLSHALPELTSRWTTTTGVIIQSSAISELWFIDWFHSVSAYFSVSVRTERLGGGLQSLLYNFYFAFVLASLHESVSGFIRILISEFVWIRLRNSDCKLLQSRPIICWEFCASQTTAPLRDVAGIWTKFRRISLLSRM